MKLFLVIAMTTLFSATAFAACSVSSLKECTTKDQCEAIVGPNGTKYHLVGGQCMFKSSQSETDCAMITDSPMAKQPGSSSSGNAETGGTAGRAK